MSEAIDRSGRLGQKPRFLYAKQTPHRKIQHHSQTAPTAFVLPSRTRSDYLSLAITPRGKTAGRCLSRRSVARVRADLPALPNQSAGRCFTSVNNRPADIPRSAVKSTENLDPDLMRLADCPPIGNKLARLPYDPNVAAFLPVLPKRCFSFCINCVKHPRSLRVNALLPLTKPESLLRRNRGQSVCQGWKIGARGEIRTRTPVRAEDFESPASTVPPLGPPVAPCSGTAPRRQQARQNERR